jgi:hypothetical protein
VKAGGQVRKEKENKVAEGRTHELNGSLLNIKGTVLLKMI